MKYRFLIYALIITSHLSAQQKCSKVVKKFLTDHHFSDAAPLYFFCINANDCVNCLLPLGDIIRQVHERKIDNVIYLIYGIEPTEVNVYAQKVLRLDIGNNIFVNDQLYKTINESPDSKIVICQNHKIVFNERIKSLPDDNRLISLFEISTKRIELVDSSSFDENLLLGTYVSDFFNDSTLFVLNSKYQEIQTIDLIHKERKKIVSNHDLGLNIDSLLAIMLDAKSDSALLWYNSWLRKQKVNFFTKNPMFPDIDIMNAVLQDNQVILVVGIPILQPFFKNADTTFMITKIPFLVKLNMQLKMEDVYCFDIRKEAQPPPDYIAGLYVPFYMDFKNNYIYFKTSYEGKSTDFNSAKSIMVCKINKNRICFDSLMPFEYPDFFGKKELFNNYNNCNFSMINEKLYFYFNFTPNFYDLTLGKEYRLNHTNFEQSLLNVHDQELMNIQFKFQTLFPSVNGYGACYISSKQNATITWFDRNWNELSVSTLSLNNVIRVIHRNNDLFIIKKGNHEGKVQLFKYVINNG